MNTPVPAVAFDYDDAGNRLWMTDGLGRVDYVHDTWSRLTSETRIFNDFPSSTYPLTYDYNLAGQLKSLTDPFGKAINYAYNSAGQLTGVTGSNFGGVTQYASNMQYRAWGGLKHMVSGDGRNIDLGYNGRLQITSFARATGFGHSNYQYYADGQASFVQFLDNPQFDRKYNYDDAGRQREGLSGTDARSEPLDPNNPNPYKQTYTYDVFENMSGRTNRYWTLEENPFAATYVNDRNTDNTAWDYNAAGNVTHNPAGSYVYDAAGRMSKFNDPLLNQSYDGDGLPALRIENRLNLQDRATIYYVRSSILGGQPVTELNAQGGKRRTYVYANRQDIARQEKRSTDSVVWISRDPITGDDDITRDPLGGFLGNENDVTFPDYASLKGDSPTHDADADPFDSGSGCTLDGIPIDCSTAMGLADHGAAFYAPLKSVLPIYNSQLRTYTGFAVFDPYLGDFVRLTQIATKKTPPVLIRRSGRVSPSDSSGDDDDDAEPTLAQSSGLFREGPLWNNASKGKQDRVIYIVQKILANQGCLDWFKAHSEAIGHGADLTKLLQRSGLNFYLAADKDRVSLSGLGGLHTNKFGVGEGFGETLFGGSANPQIVINRSVLDDKNDPELAVQLVHELFHAAGFHQGSDPKLPGIFGTPNDQNPEVKWADIKKNCRIE